MPSVSLHVRRGDYVDNPLNQKLYGTISPDYYTNAVTRIAGKMAEKPVLFVFSDDPDWVRSNMSFPYECHVVDQNSAQQPVEDLRLMSACRHHIIANSSFSWWGAWLNPSGEKTVIAPRHWFGTPGTFPDITPQNWLRI